MRLTIGIILALLVNFGLFMLMQHMTSNKEVDKQVIEDVRLLDFVRVKREEAQPETKKRQMPKKPPPPDEPPPPPETPSPQTPKPDAPTPKMDVPNVDVHMHLTGAPYLGDSAKAPAAAPAPAPAPVEGPIIDNEVVPLVRIPPQYPRVAARRGIEGIVTVRFIITKDGTVRDAQVIEAKPSNVFNDEAIEAVLKWKFKPKLVEGQPVERQATQDIEFKLSR